MYIYKNGDRCPCCGQELQDKSPEWLELFSRTVEILGLEPLPMPEIQPVDFHRPPDAGLQPVNPPQPMSSRVTVPDHGRLGDLDELKAKMRIQDNAYGFDQYGDGMHDAFQLAFECIDNAPTIIPAEEASP